MSRKTKPAKGSAQILPFPKHQRPPCLSNLPKGKQRWLRHATRTLLADPQQEDVKLIADAIRVSVALAFASNRRGEAAESDVFAWANAHPAEVTDIAFALVEEAAPEAAREALQAIKRGAT